MTGPEQALAEALNWPEIAKALFREVPPCTGCDFDHGWDDHVKAVVRDTAALATPEADRPYMNDYVLDERNRPEADRD